MNGRLLLIFALSCLGIYISLSLGTYHSYDPTFSKAFFPYVAREIQNAGGYIGANIADILIHFFGVNSWLIPFAIGIIIYRLVFPGAATVVAGVVKRKIGRRIVAVIVFFLCISALTGIIFPADPLYPAEVHAGGLLAEELTKAGTLYLGHTGSLVVHFLLGIFAFLVLIDFPSGFQRKTEAEPISWHSLVWGRLKKPFYRQKVKKIEQQQRYEESLQTIENIVMDNDEKSAISTPPQNAIRDEKKLNSPVDRDDKHNVPPAQKTVKSYIR
ncbi:DNA translocase FtsK 4TM domain-containing protein [Chrysiogenes arsenatis]|uniref:DNA translocase FtsK 4TM domain-containing protein n=1 Tax=Chrysiogenes arsenatis TaxID=309797 RepID=UPI0004093755|nr:DNA translocase FtsK 4TM domain-containing protein [Chrysiogenes arsenatis]